jgi:hypothetical protein
MNVLATRLSSLTFILGFSLGVIQDPPVRTPCSLEGFPSDAPDCSTSSCPLGLSPSGSVTSFQPPVGPSSITTILSVASSRGSEPSNCLVSAPVLPYASRPASESSSTLSDISDCVAPPRPLASSTLPARHSPASSSSDWRQSRNCKSDALANRRPHQTPRPTVGGKNLEANIDAISRPSTTFEVPQDVSPSVSNPGESLPFASSTSLEWPSSSVASDSLTLGARGGVLTQYIANTLQGNGQRT